MFAGIVTGFQLRGYAFEDTLFHESDGSNQLGSRFASCNYGQFVKLHYGRSPPPRGRGLKQMVPCHPPCGLRVAPPRGGVD